MRLARTLTFLVVGPLLGLPLAACKPSGWGEPATFRAEPAPATWIRPEKPPEPAVPPTAVVDKTAQHVAGEDRYPCEGHAICARRSPADGTLGTTIGSFESIDPAKVTETEGFLVATSLFEGLVNPARRSGEALQQGVAESWTLSADATTYTFKLRENARWSNGRAVTAEDFVYAWLRKLAPETAAVDVDSLLFIAGAADYNQGREKDPSKVGVRAIDARTLEVRLTCPTPYWPAYLASGAYLPVPKEAIEAHGRDWDRPANIITNGAYHLADLKERDRVILVRSETYWDKDNVRIPRVIAYSAETEQNASSLYEAGEVQWPRGSVSPGAVAAALSEKRPDLLIDPYLCTYVYLFRVDKAPFTDARVRRAFDMAVDKQALVDQVTRGMQIPARRLVPTSFDQTQDYPGPPGDAFDPRQAQALLAEAGFPGGRGLPTVRLLYNTMESHRMVAEFVARQLEENLGVKVEAQNMEWKSLLQQIRLGDFQMARLASCGVDLPLAFLENFTSTSPRNDPGWKNPSFDKDFQAAQCGSKSYAESLAKTAAAETTLLEDRPVMPLYFYTRPYFKAPVLRGLEPHLNDFHLFKNMWWGDVQTAPVLHPMPEPERPAP